MPKFSKTIALLPQNQGVYLFKDKNGQILYIGKANNLKKRVASYFRKTSPLPDKFPMLNKIAAIEHIVTDSEIEALLLEANLIKKYQPKYNISFKDDKQYQYIKIDYSDDFPRIYTTRKIRKNRGDYFGPFPSSKTIKQILNLLNRFLHFRECKIKMTETGVKNKKYKICLRYHLGRCLASCVGKISKKEYASQIHQCKMFLEGKKKRLLKNLENKMKLAAKQHNFEEAAKLRDQIFNIRKLNPRQKLLSPLFYDRKKEMTQQNTLSELTKILQMKSAPQRIECFDISNIQGKSACGAMVVFENGKPCKSEYRRFKIKTKSEPNDVAMMEEVLLRRFRHSKIPLSSPFSKRGLRGISSKTVKKNTEQWPLPDLVVLDGGKAQLGIALKVLKKYKLKIPAIALAKKKEEIYLPNCLKPLKLPRNSKVLLLLQNLRDEAHRFAVSYHKKLRRKTLLT